MFPLEAVPIERAHPHAEQRQADGGDDRLNLHQGDVPDDHLDDLPPALHVTQIRLSAQPRRQTHIEITLQTLQRRSQDQ